MEHLRSENHNVLHVERKNFFTVQRGRPTVPSPRLLVFVLGGLMEEQTAMGVARWKREMEMVYETTVKGEPGVASSMSQGV